MKWFKKKERTLPKDTVCRNCGTQTVGRYCHECGQDLSTGIAKPILQLIAQVLDNAFALEGKTPRTLGNLLIRPGFLSSEYRMGRISRYVLPAKMFWMSTLIFFAILISQMNMDSWLNNNTDSKIEVSNSQGLKIKLNAPSDTLAVASQNINNEDSKDSKPEPNSTDILRVLMDIFKKFAPYVTFLLIPIFAVFLFLFFWRRKYYYMYHLTFALHFHSFLWIFLSLLFLVNMITGDWKYPSWIQFLLLLLPGLYLTVAFRQFYHSSWWQSLWKAVFVTILYLILILIVTILLAILVLGIYFPELFHS